MSSDQTFSTNDIRSAAQDHKRDANHKHKWALGSVEPSGRGPGNPRPHRASETTYNMKRRETKEAVASLAHRNRIARKLSMLEGATAEAISDDSSGTHSDSDGAASSPPPDVGVMYSFDAARGPSEGSEILNTALAKAVKRFEEKETVKLIREEYDVLDSEGESAGLVPIKKDKGKARAVTVPDADEDYEFV